MATKSKKLARKTRKSVKAKTMASKVKVMAVKSDIIVQRAYRFGDKVRVLNDKGKPVAKTHKIMKPERGEPTPGKGWFLVSDGAFAHFSSLTPA